MIEIGWYVTVIYSLSWNWLPVRFYITDRWLLWPFINFFCSLIYLLIIIFKELSKFWGNSWKTDKEDVGCTLKPPCFSLGCVPLQIDIGTSRYATLYLVLDFRQAAHLSYLFCGFTHPSYCTSTISWCVGCVLQAELPKSSNWSVDAKFRPAVFG